MVRGCAARRVVSVLVSWLLLAATAPAARAFEYFDGRIQAHGYFEETIRAISTNFNEGLDLTQWYNTLHLEMDIDIAKDGWGPFDSISAYIGTEVRYDCVWTRACGFSPGVNVYGNRSEHLPSRLSDAKDPRLAGTVNYQTPIIRQPDREIETQRVYPGNINPKGTTPVTAANPAIPVKGQIALPFAVAAARTVTFTEAFRGANQASPFDALLGTRAAVSYNLVPFTSNMWVDYIPGNYTFQRFLNYGFALRNVRSGTNGMGTQAMPWDPRDDIDPNATLRNIVNPFNPNEQNPIIKTFGQQLPYRQGTRVAAGTGLPAQASGLFMPSPPYARYVNDGGTDKFDQNFSQEELAWNRGASQQQTKELKEAYLDLEMLNGSLFLRLGKQTIVWGKTELFATTDLFNPNDLALGSLTSLEESRIPLWAMRAIYSFYEVGPFEDVRLEVAVDLDDFTPGDLGRCGEAYTPNPVCDKTMGLLVHGITGLALAGENRPPHWWNSIEGLQGGARLEFRWDRFSFALVDFWNYTKLPYADRLTTYGRNVDPSTGRPRRYGAEGACTTGNEDACLKPGEDALVNNPLNQQLYATICSASVGFSGLDRSVCAFSVFTSPNQPIPGVTVAMAVSSLLSGSPTGINLTAATAFLGGDAPKQRAPLVALSIDPTDGTPTGFASGNAVNPILNFTMTPAGGVPNVAGNHNSFQTVAQVLTPQQQALLGCGPYYGTQCDGGVPGNPAAVGVGGVDLLNAEASMLTQSWIGFEGTPISGMLATDRSVAQPGTVGYRGGPTCTRVLSNGQQVILPGCRGPGDPGYDPAVDGPDPTAAGIGFPAGVLGVPALGSASIPAVLFAIGHPFTGQAWRSEMAALSWNFEMLLVAFSTQIFAEMAAGDPGSDPALRFDPANAFRTDGCSYVVPYKCSSVTAFWSITGVRRQTLNAGGNGRYGRRDMAWAQGGEAVLEYQKRNVFGFSADFAEDVTKTNWGTEFTWVRNNPYTDQNKYGGINKTDQLNLTVSVDRPTFINFLNQSRTVFFNSQWFFSYVPGYHNSFTTNGPWNVFFTFTTQTGYFQDRLLPGVTWVYDVQSESGAALPSVTYRFTESFSATFGLAFFWGRYEGKDLAVNPLTPGNQAGAWAYRTWVENGLAAIRDRDEVYMRLRYTF